MTRPELSGEDADAHHESRSEEKLAIRASNSDVIWVYGYGWPVYRGGPMF